MAQIAPISFYELDALVSVVKETKENPLYLILDQLSDVRNFGAIIRTAECTGVDGIIIQKSGSAPINGDTIKTSAGAVLISQYVKSIILKMLFFIFKRQKYKLLLQQKKQIICSMILIFNQQQQL